MWTHIWAVTLILLFSACASSKMRTLPPTLMQLVAGILFFTACIDFMPEAINVFDDIPSVVLTIIQVTIVIETAHSYIHYVERASESAPTVSSSSLEICQPCDDIPIEASCSCHRGIPPVSAPTSSSNPVHMRRAKCIGLMKFLPILLHISLDASLIGAATKVSAVVHTSLGVLFCILQDTAVLMTMCRTSGMSHPRLTSWVFVATTLVVTVVAVKSTILLVTDIYRPFHGGSNILAAGCMPSLVREVWPSAKGSPTKVGGILTIALWYVWFINWL